MECHVATCQSHENATEKEVHPEVHPCLTAASIAINVRDDIITLFLAHISRGFARMPTIPHSTPDGHIESLAVHRSLYVQNGPGNYEGVVV